jgi:hypothetical protein
MQSVEKEAAKPYSDSTVTPLWAERNIRFISLAIDFWTDEYFDLTFYACNYSQPYLLDLRKDMPRLKSAY